MQWQRIEKPEFGYAIQVPQGWVEHSPDPKIHGPWATASFVDPADRRHRITVFRQPVSTTASATGVAEAVQEPLARARFGDFRLTAAQVAGRPGARLDCAQHDAGRLYALRQYYVVDDGVGFYLSCGSSAPDEDNVLFTTVAARFELTG